MAHGLEVRVPLLDHRIAELALSLPGGLNESDRGGKRVLRQVARAYLPASLQTKPKQGFSFPLERLVSRETMCSALRHGSLMRAGLMHRQGFEDWLSSTHEPVFKLWLLFVLEHWARCWLLQDAEAIAA
jgi:asparagine synthase (glutamine-hydrolysing)